MREITPTRMALIEVRKKIALAKKGHSLLKRKRDALIMEFFRLLQEIRDKRERLNALMKRAHLSFSVAKSLHNLIELSAMNQANKREVEAHIDVHNVMGVKVPHISLSYEEHNPLVKDYLYVAASLPLEKTIELYEEVLRLLLEIAGGEVALFRLVKEIEMTKRRVNALEFILIPNFEQSKKEIALRLEEMDRDSFVALKTVKRKIARKRHVAQ